MAIGEATTTIKLSTCTFSEQKIYPGKGKMLAKTSKVAALQKNEKKPAKIRWTQSWRKAHKKAITITGANKKKAKTNVKVQKAIAGLSLDAIEKMKQNKIKDGGERPALARKAKK